MEEDINEDDSGKTSKEQILNYCFHVMDYVRNMDPRLFKLAQDFAKDSTGVQIDEFNLEEVDDDETQ